MLSVYPRPHLTSHSFCTSPPSSLSSSLYSMTTLTSLHGSFISMSSPIVLGHSSHAFAPSVFPPSIAISPKLFIFPNLLEDLQTLYLFTKSDLKTILLPVTVFASIAAPITRLERLPQVIFWIWLHLLQFCVSNQTINPEEDSINKPWRPIAAGRVTVDQAQTFRWYLVVCCLGLSLYRGVLPASILMCLATIAYNDMGLHKHVVMRNFCNAVGYASFEMGATQLGGDISLSPSTIIAVMGSALMVFTTIHAADFRDEAGDRLENKKTLPIVYPEASRISMLALLLAWSGLLGMFWNIGILLAAALLATGVLVGCRFMWRRGVTADKKSYLLYNLWLSLAHISLGVGHFRGWIFV